MIYKAKQFMLTITISKQTYTFYKTIQIGVQVVILNK